jgi:hypothetical protein
VSTPNIRPGATANQRRSQRIHLSVRLEVSGKRKNGAVFAESATTLIVNAHGGLLLLKEVVWPGQILTLKNAITTEEVSSTVVDVNPAATGAAEVGVEFCEPHPRFWRVVFPPEDWTPRSPEAKRMELGSVVRPALKPQPAKK